MSVTTTSGDILDDPSDVLVCPVNIVGSMGKGLAHRMAKTIPGLEAGYKDALYHHNLDIGRVCAVRCELVSGAEKIILLFATKRHWKNPSQMEFIEKGLDDLAWWLDSAGRQFSIAIPALGCGLGLLAWDTVWDFIKTHDVLTTVPNHITVYGPHDGVISTAAS